ncbi:hypothetical protein N0V93_003061 [Gnomoniopsis smithogilvyi]|uniref:Tat pathway signal sequence n=1 Tax=Gnomoniopsis smithogilvyi TaxID=1191159 RepID=A0A9W8YXR6_9PEZI|nr:hypothetical protein N0V93_003061 [Gnomoniopsis smithogilvyi]
MYDRKNPESQPLAGYIDASESELTPSEESFSHAPLPVRCHRNLLILGVVLFTSAISCTLGLYLGGSLVNLDAQCATYTTHYSPVTKELSIKYQEKEFNGSFRSEDVYRQEAGPEVDEAWEALGVDYRAMVISTEQGHLSGLTSGHVQRADAYGGGFFVNVEGLHHLHCLNLMRKSLYYNYDHYKALGTHAFKNDAHILRLHVSHCLDTLRQVLMCNVDTGVLGQVWYHPEQPEAFPDFNTKHTCKNYEDIRIWAEKNQEPEPENLPP